MQSFVYMIIAVAARNVELTEDGTWVILDFGLAKEMYSGQSGATYYKRSDDSLFPIRWYFIPLPSAPIASVSAIVPEAVFFISCVLRCVWFWRFACRMAPECLDYPPVFSHLSDVRRFIFFSQCWIVPIEKLYMFQYRCTPSELP
jgi:hypothetical protein